MRRLFKILFDSFHARSAKAGNALPTEGGPLPWRRPICDDPINLQEDMIRHIQEKWTCPYCQSGYGLFDGPRGGASLNLFCGNPACDSRFNVIDPKFGFIPIGQFMGRCPPEFIANRLNEISQAH